MSVSDDFKTKMEAAKSRADLCLSNYNGVASSTNELDIINAKYWKGEYDNNMSDYNSFKSRYEYYKERNE